ncbi:MAG: sigma-70 family RNA polymerase sigma factor [Planctomycetes bacterium]|nr:sigma-70 family RNA polymerase sigma factor [Planctomycetota bacterium]
MLMMQESLVSVKTHPTEPNAEELMAAFVAGNRHAFDQLYLLFAPRVRAFISRYVGDRDSGDDLLQEVFLKVYRKSETFDPSAHLSTWLFTIARNACIDHLRRRRLPLVAIGGEYGDVESDEVQVADLSSPSPWEQSQSNEFATLLEQQVARLSPKLRLVFLLCAVQELSYEEAAKIIGCPIKTVSSRLSRAREQVYENMKQHLDETGIEM